MNKAFIVTHVDQLPNGEEDMTLAGVFATQADAAVERARGRPGFSDWPGGFQVDGYEIGKDHWIEGFVTWRPDTSRA